MGQFRQLHGFLPRWRQTIEAELPEVASAMDRAGALRTNSVHNAPPELTGGPRPGDERFELLTARRPVMEAALARTAAATPGVTVERGVTVTGLCRRPPAAPASPTSPASPPGTVAGCSPTSWSTPAAGAPPAPVARRHRRPARGRGA